MSLIGKLVRYALAKQSQTIAMHTALQDITQNPKIHQIHTTQALLAAREQLRSGAVIALPTDTVYGLACDANNEKAIQQLYSIKGRHFQKPVAICVEDLAALRRYGHAEHLSDAVLSSLLPGPITIIIERSNALSNRFLNPSTTKIGIRIPDCLFIQKLCALYNEQPLALTSANRSSERSSLQINEFAQLWPQLGGVFDAGPIGLTEERRSASTVIDLSLPGCYKVVREGVALKSTLSILQSFGLRKNDEFT